MSKSKKIIKILFLLILLFISFIFIEMLSVSFKYVNKPFVTFDINNIRNPQIKKITRTIDNIYSVILLKVSDQHKNYLDQRDDNFDQLPQQKIIKAESDNFTLSKLNKPGSAAGEVLTFASGATATSCVAASAGVGLGMVIALGG